MTDGRRRKALTEDAVREFKCEPGQRARYLYDAKRTGFAVRAYPSGGKSFVMRRMVNGARLEILLGTYPAMTLTQARARWEEEAGKLTATRRETDEQRRQREELAAALAAVRAREEREQAAEAQQAEREAERERQRASLTVAEVMRRYVAERPDLKPRTRENYTRDADMLPKAWKERPAHQLTPEDVRTWYRARITVAETAGNRQARSLRAAFNHAMSYTTADGLPLIEVNPVSAALNKGGRQARSLWAPARSREEYLPAATLPAFFEITDHAPGDSPMVSAYKTAARLSMFCGLRLKELREIQWADVDLRAGWLTLRDTKSRIPQRAPIGLYMAALLAAHHKRQPGAGLVFRNNAGNMVDPSGRVMKSLSAAIAQAAGLPRFGFHDLRRTFATHAGELLPAHVVERLLRHSDAKASTAERHYLKATPERLKDAVHQLEEHFVSLANRTAERDALLTAGNVVALQQAAPAVARTGRKAGRWIPRRATGGAAT